MYKNRNLFLFTILIVTLPFLAFYTINYFDSHFSGLPTYGPTTQTEDGKVKAHQVIPFQFLNQDSVLVKSTDFKDKIWIVDFFFASCPTICPKLTRSMKKVRESFLEEDPITLMSFTVDPKHDQPSRLKRYAEQYNAQWTFLTGEKQKLYALARNGFFLSATEGDGGPTDFIHSEKIVLVDPLLRIRGYYDGTDEAAVDQLILDIIKLKNEFQ